MSVVSPPGTWFPDAFIRLVPIFRNILTKADQDFLRASAELTSMLQILRTRVDHLAIDIELKLVARLVADANRAGITIPAQLTEVLLARGDLSKQRIKNFEFRLGQTS